MERIEEINKRLAEIEQLSHDAEGEKLEELVKEADKLAKERDELKKAAADAEKRSMIAAKIDAGEMTGVKLENKVVKENKNMENKLDSVEYRNAFMQFAKSGEMAEEFRDVALTSNNQAVIPPTTLNKIIEKVESYGNLLQSISYMNYPAGVAVPTSELAAPATWTSDAELASKGAAVDGKITGFVSFSAFPLVKSIGLSFMTQVQSLSAFEAALANNVAQAMAKALEAAVVNGSGNGMPTGILKANPAKTVTLNDKLSFKDIIALKAAVPSAYRTGAVLVVNEATFYDFMSIVDNAGQPICRVNFGLAGEPEYQMLGTRVVVTDHLPALAEAGAGKEVGFICQLDKYVINTAHQIDLVTYVDQTTRNKVYQSFAALDGKLVDSNGLVIIKKAGSAKA